MTWVMPFPESSITGEYGTMSAYRKKNGLQAHSGTDWAPAGSNKGTTIIPAVADGEVALIHYSKFLGWVVVQTAMDKAGQKWYIGYCHLKCKTHGINCKSSHAPEAALDVRLGDKLTAGDISHGMTMGTTGVSSSGVHLHATLAKTVKGVFGMTKDKFDLKKAIKANAGPGPEKNVVVELEPKNGNVIVHVKKFPAGYKLRLRKDGQSVWDKTGKSESEVHSKGVSLTKTHVLSLEINDMVFWKETVSKGIKAPPKMDHQRVIAEQTAAAAKPEPKSEPAPTPTPAAPVTVSSLSVDDWKKFQEILKRDHGYAGAIDGVPGAMTYKALQRSVAAHGYSGPVDGQPGGMTYKGLQRRLVAKGTYEGRVDGNLGPATYTAWKAAIDKNVY
jgi:hypothetical protein